MDQELVAPVREEPAGLKCSQEGRERQCDCEGSWRRKSGMRVQTGQAGVEVNDERQAPGPGGPEVTAFLTAEGTGRSRPRGDQRPAEWARQWQPL